MIKAFLFVTLYIILIPCFYLLFLWGDWFSDYDHESLSFSEYLKSGEYNCWNDTGKNCLVMSILFPIGIVVGSIVFIYRWFRDLDLIQKIASLIEKFEK